MAHPSARTQRRPTGSPVARTGTTARGMAARNHLTASPPRSTRTHGPIQQLICSSRRFASGISSILVAVLYVSHLCFHLLRPRPAISLHRHNMYIFHNFITSSVRKKTLITHDTKCVLYSLRAYTTLNPLHGTTNTV